MPLLLWPFPSGGTPPPPVHPRAPTGKVFIIDSEHGYFFGPAPVVNESCSMVFNVGPGPTVGTSVRLFFTSPYGVTQEGDADFAFVTPQTIAEIFPIEGFPRSQSFTYTFGIGELAVVGLWQVYALSGNFRSNPVTFRVNPINRRH